LPCDAAEGDALARDIDPLHTTNPAESDALTAEASQLLYAGYPNIMLLTTPEGNQFVNVPDGLILIQHKMFHFRRLL